MNILVYGVQTGPKWLYVYEENGESNAQHLTENLGSELITKDSS